jgi:hypothetical protein
VFTAGKTGHEHLALHEATTAQDSSLEPTLRRQSTCDHATPARGEYATRGYSRPLVRVTDYLKLISHSTYDGRSRVH